MYLIRNGQVLLCTQMSDHFVGVNKMVKKGASEKDKKDQAPYSDVRNGNEMRMRVKAEGIIEST